MELTKKDKVIIVIRTVLAIIIMDVLLGMAMANKVSGIIVIIFEIFLTSINIKMFYRLYEKDQKNMKLKKIARSKLSQIKFTRVKPLGSNKEKYYCYAIMEKNNKDISIYCGSRLMGTNRKLPYKKVSMDEFVRQYEIIKESEIA